MKTQIRRRSMRRLIRVCTVCTHSIFRVCGVVSCLLRGKTKILVPSSHNVHTVPTVFIAGKDENSGTKYPTMFGLRGLSKQCRPRSNTAKMRRLIRVGTVCTHSVSEYVELFHVYCGKDENTGTQFSQKVWANSVDPDQTPQNEASNTPQNVTSDLGLHCLLLIHPLQTEYVEKHNSSWHMFIAGKDENTGIAFTLKYLNSQDWGV